MPFFKLNKDFTLLLIIFSGFIGLASCETEEPGCYELKVVSGKLGFQKRDTIHVKDTISLDPLATVDKVIYRFSDSEMIAPEMRVLNEDSSLTIRGAKSAGEMLVAFNQAKDSIRYTFRTDTASTVYDTITIHYTPALHFISNNCGYNYYFGIDRIAHTTNMIDSFALTNREVTEIPTRNVQFYFKRKF